MKVGEITEKGALERTDEVPKDKRSAGTGDFKRLFEGELSALAEGPSSSAAALDRAVEVSGGFELPPVSNTGMPWNEGRDAASAARGVGEKLETIGRLMEDGRASLKQIDETLGALAREAEELQEKVKGLPEDHTAQRQRRAECSGLC